MSGKGTYGSWNGINSGEEIVISGIAGRFPSSDNLYQLRDNLFNKVDLIKANHLRWNINHPDIPTRMGTINNIKKFDADFFGISVEQAHVFSPDIRMLLEHTYEAIIDAGVNPKQLQGTNTAVIIGLIYSETQGEFMFHNVKSGGKNVIGGSKSMTANMISYFLNLKGPSTTIDSACSSSLHALAYGYDCIMSGLCEDAIIGTTNLCLHPMMTLHFARLGIF
ncbi:fatty acid synthase-like [Monomorium pharaonis]|uniref:fatty acid synthase-like n=1 Tax=Monomorium pharaonis TaxID=307658 RepID=UPI00102E1E37|nr:fatty acid synthase-like [Monomorium pharaonis]